MAFREMRNKTKSDYLKDQYIHHLLKAQAERTLDAIAIAAPERVPLTYGQLCTHIDDVVKTLNIMGVGRNDPGQLFRHTGSG